MLLDGKKIEFFKDEKYIFFSFIGLAISFLISIAIMQIFLVVICILGIFRIIQSKSFSTSFIQKLLIAYVIIRIISIIFSKYPEVSNDTYLKELLFYLSIFAFNYFMSKYSIDKLKSIIAALIIGSVVVSLYGIISFNFGMYHRAQSFTSGYMTFSNFLVVVLILTLTISDKIKILNNSYYRISIFTLLISGIVLSQSRLDIAIVALFLIFIAIFKRISYKDLLSTLILSAVIIFISFGNNSKSFEERISNPSTLSDRDVIYEGFNQLKFEQPLIGFGPRTFKKIFPYRDKFRDKKIGSWHNDLITVYIESGVAALLIFLFLYVVFILKFFRIFTSKKSNESFWIECGTLFSICALLIISLTSGIITSPIISILFLLLVSIYERAEQLKID